MKFTIKGIVKKISNLPDEIKFNKLKERAENSDVTAYHDLAECYHKGIGTRRNYKQSLKWYIKEAELGNADAQYALGMRYWKGEKLVGGEKNEDEALRWIEKAAEKGHKKAIAFIDENDASDPAKLQAKIDKHSFGNITKTIKLAEKIQDVDKREEYVRKAISFYETNIGLENIILLLDYINDQDYKVFLLLKHQVSLSTQNLIKKYETEATDKEGFKLSLAKAYEKVGDMDNAFLNYISSSNHEEIASFLCRRAKELLDSGKLFEAQDKVQEALKYDFNTASKLNQQIYSVIRTKYSDDALELIAQINDAEDIEELNALKDKAEDSELKDEFKNRAVNIIQDAMANAETSDELAELEDYVKVYGLEGAYYKRQKELVAEEIDTCEDIDELEELIDISTECGLEDCYNEKYEKLGGNIEEQIAEAEDLKSLAELEEIAYQRNCEGLLLENVGILMDDRCFNKDLQNLNYIDFKHYETKQSIIDKITDYLNEEYENIGCEGVSNIIFTTEDQIDRDLWIDLPKATRAQVKCAECYNAIIEEHLEEALEAYCSPDFEDLEGWSGDGVEEELEHLLFNEQEKWGVSIIELYEKYGKGDEEAFLGEDLGDAYYKEGLELEDDDIEKAVKYYKKAAEKYGNAEAKAKLDELYEE